MRTAFRWTTPSPCGSTAPSSAACAPLLEKRHVLIGGGLIFIGGWAIFSSFVSPLIYYFVETMGYESWYLRSILNRIPSVVVAVAVIFFGIYLVKGKKRPVQPEEEFVEYRGDSNE